MKPQITVRKPIKANINVRPLRQAIRQAQGKPQGKPLRQAALLALKSEGIAAPVELSILLCDDAFIRDLNRLYRGEDTATDVLAFPQATARDRGQGTRDKGNSSAVACPMPHLPCPMLLGDVVVSVETAARQAKRYKHSLEEELARLIVHGVLHLLGYDDVTKKERRQMMSVERRIMRAWRKACLS